MRGCPVRTLGGRGMAAEPVFLGSRFGAETCQLGISLLHFRIRHIPARIPLPARCFLAALGRSTFSPGEGIF